MEDSMLVRDSVCSNSEPEVVHVSHSISEFEVICHELEDIEAEESTDVKLNIYKERFKWLLDIVPNFENGVILGKERLKYLSRIIIIAAGHSGRHYWVSTKTRELAKNVLTAVSKIYSQNHYETLLVEEIGLLETIINNLKKILTKEKWKNHPVQKHALVWCIKTLKHPHVGEWLPSFIPPILWMCDDYQDYHKTLSLSCISHIIDQTDPTELRWHGRVDLLYQAIKPLLYLSSCVVIYSLHSCLYKLLPVLNYSTQTPPIPAKPNKTDEVFSILVNSLAKESNFLLRQAYATQINGYVSLLGIFSVRHMKDLLPLLLSGLDYSQHSDSSLLTLYLETLSTLICSAWPRIPVHKMSILKALSKLVSDIYPDVDTHSLDDNSVQTSIVKCMSILMTACPELKEEYRELEKSCAHQKMRFFLQKTLQN